MDARGLFEILVRENADMLTVYLRSVVRDRDAIDDLFQDTMLTAWRRIGDFDRSRPFGPWLRGIAGKLVLAHRRKSADAMLNLDEQVLEYVSQRLDQLQRQPGDTFDERLTAVRECLATLPDAYRDAIRLRYEENLSRADMAERLALTVETVKKRLQRGRSRLLDCMTRKLAAESAQE